MSLFSILRGKSLSKIKFIPSEFPCGRHFGSTLWPVNPAAVCWRFLHNVNCNLSIGSSVKAWTTSSAISTWPNNDLRRTTRKTRETLVSSLWRKSIFRCSEKKKVHWLCEINNTKIHISLKSYANMEGICYSLTYPAYLYATKFLCYNILLFNFPVEVWSIIVGPEHQRVRRPYWSWREDYLECSCWHA